MLATLSDKPFSDPNWIFEPKLDGMRCLLEKKGSKIVILSRNRKIQNNVFPEIVAALKKYKSDFIIDSEIVTFVGKTTSFSQLQLRMHVQNPDPKLLRKVPVVAYLFDIIHLNGYDLTKMPLIARKHVLKDNFKLTKPLFYLAHKNERGLVLFKQACKQGLEGLIAKRADSTYQHHRSRDWLKLKCGQEQEFVIAGYTKPQGSRAKFGALLLGYYENKKLKYAGRVGTGFNDDTLIFLHKKMSVLHAAKSPFSDYDLKSNAVTWLKPKLVAQVEFFEWTTTGRLRHPSFKGIRTDKSASDVRREGI